MRAWQSLLIGAVAIFAAAEASAASRNILVIGFWPPTNEMLRSFSPNPRQNNGVWRGRNWESRGYDIYAFFPEFRGPNDSIGHGDFPVDFAAAYNDFQRIVRELKPVAILAFGKGDGPWEIESTFPPYYQAMFAAGNLPTQIGEAIAYPIPASLAQDRILNSTLPMQAIADAVNATEGALPARIDDEGAGDFLCGFLGYLATWYQSEHADPSDPAHVSRAGFIHVSGSATEAYVSFQASLRALVANI